MDHNFIKIILNTYIKFITLCYYNNFNYFRQILQGIVGISDGDKYSVKCEYYAVNIG
jgi:hypothetical protein